MVSQELLNYIKGELSRGTSKDVIWHRLMENGWPEFKINEAFNSLETPKELPKAQEAAQPAQASQEVKPEEKYEKIKISQEPEVQEEKQPAQEVHPIQEKQLTQEEKLQEIKPTKEEPKPEPSAEEQLMQIKARQEQKIQERLKKEAKPKKKFHDPLKDLQKVQTTETSHKPIEKPHSVVHEHQEEGEKFNTGKFLFKIVTNKFFTIFFAILLLLAIFLFAYNAFFPEGIQFEKKSESMEHAEKTCTNYCKSGMCGLFNNPEFTHPELEGKTCPDLGFKCLQMSGEPLCEAQY